MSATKPPHGPRPRHLRRAARPRARIVPAVAGFLLALLLASASASAQWTGYDERLRAELQDDMEEVLKAEGVVKEPGDDGIAPVPGSRYDAPPLPTDPEFRDPRGTAVSRTTVLGLILVCRTYARTAGAVADQFGRIRNGGREDKAERLADVEDAARELAELKEDWDEAARDYRRLSRGAARTSGRGSDREDVRLRRGLERAKETQAAAREAFTRRREELVARLPELAVEVDGVPLWEAFAGFDAASVGTPGQESEGVTGWLGDRLAGLFDEGEPVPEAAKTQLYNRYLETGREAMLEEKEAADCGRTVEELWKYGSPAYRSTREAVKRSGGDKATLAADLMEELEANYEAYATQKEVDEGWTDVVMAGAGALLIPMGPAVCAGYAVVEIYKEGSDVVVAYRSAEAARARAPVEGYRHVVTEEERLAAEAGELAFTAVTVAPDFLEGVSAVRVLRPADGGCPRPAPEVTRARDAPPPTTAGERPPASDRPETPRDGGGEATERLPEPDLPPADGADGARSGDAGDTPRAEEAVEERGARPAEEVADDPGYLDVGARPDGMDEAVEELREAMERARAEGVPEDRIESAVGDLSDADETDVLQAAERVETVRTGCSAVERAPVRELAEIFTRTAGNGGRFHPEHYEWLRRMVAEYPNFFDVLPNTLYDGEPLLGVDAAAQLEEWFRRGRVRTPGSDELPAFGWTRGPCSTADLPPAVAYERYLEEEQFRRAETQVDPDEAADPVRTGGDDAPPMDSGEETDLRPGRERPADPGAGTPTGEEAEAPDAGADPDDAAGGRTEELPPPDEAADADGAPPTGAAGQLGQAGNETAQTGEIEEDAGADGPGPETGGDRGGEGGGTGGDVATGGFYDITEVVDPIDIVLTPIERPREDRPVTDPGDEPEVATGPETGGGGAPPGDTPRNDEGEDAGTGENGAEDPPGGDDGTEVPLEGADAGEILNAPVATEGERDPDVQAMIIESVDLEVAPAGRRSGRSGPGAAGEGAGPAAAARGARRRPSRAGPSAARGFGRRPAGPAPGRIAPGSGETGRGSGGPELEAYITSLGGSTGETFRIHVLNRGPGPVSLGGDGLVVEPVRLEEEARRELESRLRDLASENPTTRKLTGYCLEFLRRPPTPGRLFRIAGRELQERFAPARKILQAAREVEDAGLLNPDSDPAGYVDSITQWAIWSDERGFDLDGFRDAFLEHTRENFDAAGRRWTDEIEDSVESLIPNRWRDVQRVLREARRPPEDEGSS